jgi:penicillin amidase
MKQLQNDNYNSLAATAKPVLLKNLNDSLLSSQEKFYYDVFKQWNLQNGYQEKGATLFVLWYDTLMQMVFNDELSKMKEFGLYPAERTLLEAVLRDSAFSYVDDKHTPQVETWKDMVLLSFKAVVPKCMQLEKEQKLEWGVYKNTTVYHLLRSSLMPFARTGLPIGGGRHIVNATQHNHGPSWKMIIHLKQETEAFVVYPGGQSGNPGSRYYDQFVDTWASGSYYKAWIFRKGQESNPAIKWRMTFSKS